MRIAFVASTILSFMTHFTGIAGTMIRTITPGVMEVIIQAGVMV